MKCPVCNRNLAPTLSICLTCGTMMNDSVREELQTKISPVSGSTRVELKPDSIPALAPPPNPSILETLPAPARAVKRVETANLTSPKTSPTLVDFQNKSSSMPEWRLQMQNAVRQRRGGSLNDAVTARETPVIRGPLKNQGANAFCAEVVNRPEPPEIENADPRLVAALRRISESRKAYLPLENTPNVGANAVTPKSFPFNVVRPTPNPTARPPIAHAAIAERSKPSMVTPLRIEKKLDTNKLPRIETVITDPVEDTEPVGAVAVAMEPTKLAFECPAQAEFSDVKRIVISAGHHDNEHEDLDRFEAEIEDLAPFSMRFNAGLFDLIIGVIASMIVLSPITLAGGNWFNVAGILTFAGTCAIILFLYMTASIGFVGKTLGMRLFSLELVDAEENEYPTLHQAAVSSSLYIISLVLGGAGFLTVFFNEEKRAVHDLLSGTIIVREF